MIGIAGISIGQIMHIRTGVHLCVLLLSYLCMARTTLVLEETLLRQLKKKAASEGRTFQSVANELLRRGLAEPVKQPYRLKMKGWKAELQPGVDILDRDSLFDILDKE